MTAPDPAAVAVSQDESGARSGCGIMAMSGDGDAAAGRDNGSTGGIDSTDTNHGTGSADSTNGTNSKDDTDSADGTDA